MGQVVAAALSVAFMFAPIATYSAESDADEVLRGIPAIAKAFAPLSGVNWREFAQVLAGICAVESKCDPKYPHYTSSGKYSQYQGLFQMNGPQVTLAEQQVQHMLPRIQQLVQSGHVPEDAYNFVRLAVEQASNTSGDRRFFPAYGMILGAAKHIQLNKQLATRYPNDPIWQAAGHLTAQFAGVTEGKIRASNFTAPISGSTLQTGTEAWALGQNGVQAQGTTVHDAIGSAVLRYREKMQAMMNRMAQVTNDLSLVPPRPAPFTPPAYNSGAGPFLSVSYGGVSTLMEDGYIPRTLAPTMTVYPSLPASVYNAAQPIQPAQPTLPGVQQPQTPSTSVPGSSVSTSQAFSHLVLVQPATARPGAEVLVSWTSVGMKSGSCSIGIKGLVEIARASEGSQWFSVPADSPTGDITFELGCVSPDGSSVATEASLHVVQ